MPNIAKGQTVREDVPVHVSKRFPPILRQCEGCFQVLYGMRVYLKRVCDCPMQILGADQVEAQQRIDQLGASVADE